MSLSIEKDFFVSAKKAVKAISQDAPKLELVGVAPDWLVMTHLQDPWLNLGFTGSEGGLQKLHEELLTRQLPGFVYGPSSMTQNEHLGFSTLQIRQLDDSVRQDTKLPVDVLIEKATTLPQIGVSNLIQHQAFGTDIDDLNQIVNVGVLRDKTVGIYTLVHEGRPTSTVTLISGRMANKPDVQVWSMATLPEFQGQGFGTTLLERVLSDSAENGYQSASLLASPEGKHLYDRLDFVTISQNPLNQIGI